MSGLRFFALTKRKSGWGICGSSCGWVWCFCLVCCDLPAHLDRLGPCTNVVFDCAYAHVRTEPQCDIGHTRGKKKRCLPDVRAAAFKLEAGKIEFSAFSVGELAELKKQWARLMHWL